MNLKNDFDFIADWFVNKNIFTLNEIKISLPKNFNYSNYKIIGIYYAGVINETLFCLIEKKLLTDDFIKWFKEEVKKQSSNIEVLILKKIYIKFLDFYESIDGGDGLSLRFIYNNKFNVIFFLSNNFIYKILVDIFKYKSRLSLFESLQKIKNKIYKSNIILNWELKNFVNILPDKEIQILINTLLRNNIIEETMLAALIAGTGEKWVHNKIYLNLSKNMKSEMDYILNNSYPDRRWISEVLLIVKSSISKMLFEEVIKFEKFEYIFKLKEKIRFERYEKIFREKPFDIWLKEIYDKGLITELIHKSERNLLIKSIADYPEEFLEFYYVGLSNKAKSEYKSDFLYFKDNSKKDDIYRAKIKVVEVIKEIYYSEESKRIKYFYDIIKGLSREELEYLIMEVGITKFAQATLSATKEFKRDIYTKLTGNLRDLMFDIYVGRIKFKSGFGEQTVNKNKRDIIKTYLYLKDNIFTL